MNSCKVCSSKNISKINNLTIFNKKVSLFNCPVCQYSFTEKPYWLKESYNSIINDTDIGLLRRNIFNSNFVYSVFNYLGYKDSKLIDIAGGYGVLVRLLRDKGIDAFWEDKYCENIFAKPFTNNNFKNNYKIATGFEYMEHLENPLSELDNIFKNYSKNFLFSTLLLPKPAPMPDNWWYYGQEHGQHISFYRVETLEYIAEKFQKKLTTNRINYHMIGDDSINKIVFKILLKICSFYNFFKKNNKNYLNSDYKYIIKRNYEDIL